MPRARKHLVCLDRTPYYHVVSRCVRRAFLCGKDPLTGKSFEHRRRWVEDRIRVLSSVFHVEVCTYAVMSNHYHLVVRLVPGNGSTWSDDEVMRRWTALFRGPLLVQRYRAGQSLSGPERETLSSIAAVYRKRLHSLSWFMKCLNEPIARKANAEDRCTGHFWEARFFSEPLYSEAAVLKAMAYTDLNPVRAGIAPTPEESRYTGVRARLKGDYESRTLSTAVTRLLKSGELRHFDCPVRPLVPFSSRRHDDPDTQSKPLPMHERDYLKLLDTAGRAIASGKSGRIHSDIEPILTRLGLETDAWESLTVAKPSDRRVTRWRTFGSA